MIDRLGPLAVADSPWFGSAGELVAIAYLEQDKPEQAGPLLVAIAQDEEVPQPIRARGPGNWPGCWAWMRSKDVEAALAEITGEAPQQAATPQLAERRTERTTYEHDQRSASTRHSALPTAVLAWHLALAGCKRSHWRRRE